jgi:hypothetical protein
VHKHPACNDDQPVWNIKKLRFAPISWSDELWFNWIVFETWWAEHGLGEETDELYMDSVKRLMSWGSYTKPGELGSL